MLLPFVGVGAMSLAARLVQPPLTALQAIRLVQGQPVVREIVELDAMSPDLPRAVIASEDNRFCVHGGVDWPALGAEWRRWRAGERPRGASTLTMQLTRNLFLWPHRSGLRKMMEIAFAPVVDAILPKRRQLALYLNQVEFGPGLYGVGAAARRYFGKHAADLSRGEAATLVALLPGPLVRQPGDLEVRAQAARIERRLGQLGPLLDCAEPR